MAALPITLTPRLMRMLMAESPHKTRFHELAHVVHGHCSEGLLSDDERTSHNIREVEAEGVAFIVCTLLGLPGSMSPSATCNRG